MTKKHWIALAIATLVVSPATTVALVPFVTASIKWVTQTSTPCASGTSCMWVKTSDDTPYWHKTDNTNTSMLGGGGSTGNYTFSTNTMDLSGAATMSIAPTTASAITLGQTTTFASGKDLIAAGGASDFDFSASSGFFKSPTGAMTFAPSSLITNAVFTKAFAGWSLVDLCVGGVPSSCTGTGSNTTAGVKLYFTISGLGMTGIRAWWDGSASLTLNLKLWTGGSAIKTCTVAVTTAGAYSCTFGSAQTLTPGTIYYVTEFSDASHHYAYVSDTTYGTPGNSTPTTRQMAGPFTMYIDNSAYCAGDCQPNASGGSGNFMPVEPILTLQ